MKCVDCETKNGYICLDDAERCKECNVAKWPVKDKSVQCDTVTPNDLELNGFNDSQWPGDLTQSQTRKGPSVNELLCLVVNEMDTLISELCSDFYSDSEIDPAKDIVSKLGPTEKRYPRRKGQNTKVSTIQDILHIMLELETDSSMCCKGLGKYPPPFVT